MKRIQKLCALFIALFSAVTAISPFKIYAADETFSIADVVRLQQYLLGETADVPAAYDVNADGKLNAVDLTLMKRQLMPVWTAAD